jgi:hypothetical protein
MEQFPLIIAVRDEEGKIILDEKEIKRPNLQGLCVQCDVSRVESYLTDLWKTLSVWQPGHNIEISACFHNPIAKTVEPFMIARGSSQTGLKIINK